MSTPSSILGSWAPTTTTWAARERAACGPDADSFFDPKRADEALRICAGCEVRDPCSRYAEANDEQFGIWGGVVRGFVPSGGNRKGWSERVG